MCMSTPLSSGQQWGGGGEEKQTLVCFIDRKPRTSWSRAAMLQQRKTHLKKYAGSFEPLNDGWLTDSSLACASPDLLN